MRTEQNIYKRKDGRWEGRYLNGKTKYMSVYAKSYAEVKEKLNRARLSIADTPKVELNFSNVCFEWLKSKNKVKESTFAKYNFILERYILPNNKNAKLYQLNKNSLNGLLLNNAELSQATLKNISSVFKSVINFANEKYNANIELNKHIFKGADNETVKVLSLAEQEKLIKYLLISTDLIKAGILLDLYTGLRIGELCALKWSDFDFENDILRVNKTIQRVQIIDKTSVKRTQLIIQSPKSRKSIREIPLSESIVPILKRLKINGNLYFLSGSTNPTEPRTLQNQFKKILKNARVENTNFHALRHTFATRAIESGIDVKSVSELLGHSSVKMTLEKYVHISMEQKKKDINKLNLF